MNAATLAIGRFIAEEVGHDDKGITSHSSIFPEKAEIIYGGLASLIILGLLIWKGGPAIKKGMAARTAKIQKELDDAANAKTSANDEAAQIVRAKGDINAERDRLLAAADAQAATLIEESRARLTAELADIEAKATLDIEAARGRAGDELRAEIARLSSAAVEQVVTGSLDDATHQELIESFISRVGATAGASA